MRLARLLALDQLDLSALNPSHEASPHHPTDHGDETAAALSAMGLRLQGPAPGAAATPPPAVLWPSQLPSLQAWLCVQTQWRHHPGSGYLCGLDYAGLRAWLCVHEPADQHAERFGDLCAMESAVLRAEREDAQRQAQRRRLH